MLTTQARSSSRLTTWGLRVAGTLLFLGLLLYLDLSGKLPVARVFEELKRANPLLVALSVALYAPFLIVKALRWRSLSRDMGMPMPLRDAWRIYAIGLAAGTFTPGQAGDALKAVYLARQGRPFARALGSSVLDRVFDVGALAVLGLMSVAVFGGQFAGQAPVLVGWVVFSMSVVAFFAWNRTRSWAVNLVSKRLANMAAGRGGDVVQHNEPWSFNVATLAGAGALTVASFIISIFRVWLLAAALGVFLGPLEVSAYVGVTTAAALVPVSVGGIGTRDAMSALALSQLHHRPDEGIALSLLILLLNLSHAIIGWVVWLRYRPEAATILESSATSSRPAL